MRNLKKFLALVLAMAMAFSLMLSANAAVAFDDYKDKDDIVVPEFAEAVSVLSGLGVIKGYEDGTFDLSREITRAEAAAIIYRTVTGDVGDTKIDLYKDYTGVSGQPADTSYKNPIGHPIYVDTNYRAADVVATIVPKWSVQYTTPVLECLGFFRELDELTGDLQRHVL